MKISKNTKVHNLLREYPFLEDFLIRYNKKFQMLKNPVARATLGRVATLEKAAATVGIDAHRLVEDISKEIEKKGSEKRGVRIGPVEAKAMRKERIEALKQIIKSLHDGGDLDVARKQFAETVKDVEASEIAAMEEELIREGLPVSEVQRLCDVHVGAFREALDQHAEVQAPPGHPVHTYLTENKIIANLADQLSAVVSKLQEGGEAGAILREASDILHQLRGLDNHYQRKENQLFPFLERHGITGPSQVMWAIHDEIRAKLRSVLEAVEKGDKEFFLSNAPGLARDIIEMVYKEEKVLFPLAMDTLSGQEWAEVRKGEDELGYVLAEPQGPWPKGYEESIPSPEEEAKNKIQLKTGRLSLEQLNLVLTHLPVDLTFVDENDMVQFYSEGPERIFPRSPAIIGRKVQNCHPPKSLHVVEKILSSFRSGERDVAEFWIDLRGKFIHIRYFAVRDGQGRYRGCLEVSQDITQIRKLQGERRLLSWQS